MKPNRAAPAPVARPQFPVPWGRAFAVLGYAIFSLVALALLLELFCAGAIWLHHALFRPSGLPEEYRVALQRCYGVPDHKCRSFPEDVGSANPIYDAYSWADEFWKEERAREQWWWVNMPYEPFVIWGNRTVRGALVEVAPRDGGVWRRTIAPQPGCAQPPITIWAFGGSALFGSDSPDAYTIPSLVAQRLAHSTQRCIHMVNMGVEGYVSNQELLLLRRQLQAGPPPDLVIFYDGFNDAQADHPFAHIGLPSIERRFDKDRSLLYHVEQALRTTNSYRVVRAVWKRFGSPPPSPSSAAGQEQRARTVLDRYESNLSILRMLGRQYGFTPYVFWQPSLWFSVPRGTEQNLFVRIFTDPRLRDQWVEESSYDGVIAVYREAERRAPRGGFTFLGHGLDDANQLVYVDEVHLGPNGNQVVAVMVADVVGRDPIWTTKVALQRGQAAQGPR